MPSLATLPYTATMEAPQHPDNFVPLAWNGLRLNVPDTWQPTRLGLRYVLLTDDNGPAFEWKWRPDAGRDGMAAALRALTPKRRAHTGMTLPDAWLDALSPYELMPLSWRCEGQSGLGAALFHPETGMVAVFQAYGGEDGPSAERLDVVAAVLAGLRHDSAGAPQFRIYGLNFTPPAGYALAAFEFVPGRFALNFAAGRRRLDVVRLAPAEVLLAEEPLGSLAVRVFGFDPSILAEPAMLGDMPAVWLACRQGDCLVARLARFLGKPGRLAVMRHLTDVDKLLGVAATDRNSVDRQWLADVAVSCVSL